MCTHLAAANEYKLSHLQSPEVWAKVEATTTAFYVGGYHLTVCPPAALALGKHAAETNKIYMLSLSAGFIPQFFKDPLAEVVPYCDYIFGNENEAKTWAEAAGHKDISIPEAAKLMVEQPKINTKRPRVVIITQGTEPTIVAIKEEGKDAEIKEFPVAAIEESLINDTNGAGDAFAGGFAAGIVEGDSLEVAIKKGHWLARLGLQELGPSYVFSSFPSSPSSYLLSSDTNDILSDTHTPSRPTRHDQLSNVWRVITSIIRVQGFRSFARLAVPGKWHHATAMLPANHSLVWQFRRLNAFSLIQQGCIPGL